MCVLYVTKKPLHHKFTNFAVQLLEAFEQSFNPMRIVFTS